MRSAQDSLALTLGGHSVPLEPWVCGACLVAGRNVHRAVGRSSSVALSLGVVQDKR